MQKADKITGILLMILSTIFGVQALRLPGPIGGRGVGPGGFPLVVSAGLLICGILLVCRSVRGKGVDGNPSLVWPQFRGQTNFYIVFIASFAYLVLIYLLGFVLCTFLYLSLLIKFLGKFRWRSVILISVPSTIFLYYAFKVWFYMPFPQGMFW
jgi:putative tricarboxylic transport membrane protein